MKRLFKFATIIIIIIAVLQLFSFVMYGSLTLTVTPSPRDPDDSASSCHYEYCYDKCIQSSDFSRPLCVKPLCGPDTDKYYCVLVSGECTKKLKPRCIEILGSYLCSNLKFYSRESCWQFLMRNI